MMTSSNGSIFCVTAPLWGGSHRSPADSPHKGQWRGTLMYTLIYAWTNGGANNRDAGNLRRHCAHYDVIVMRHFTIHKGILWCTMMTSSDGNIFRVTGHLCGEFTGDRWIPRTKASDAELWFFFYLRLNDGRVNNREAGDLRRHRAPGDVTVMTVLWHIKWVLSPGSHCRGLVLSNVLKSLQLIRRRGTRGWNITPADHLNGLQYILLKYRIPGC